MKITLRDLVNSQSTLAAIKQRSDVNRVPFKTAYTLARNIKKIVPEIETYEELHENLVKSLGEEFEGGWRVTKDNTEEFGVKYAELLDTEIEIDLWKLPLEDATWGDLLISVDEAFRIWYLLEEPAQ